MRGFPVQAFSGTAVQAIHDHGKFLLGNGMKWSGFGKILPHQAVGVLVGPTLPGGIGISKIGRGFQGAVDLDMSSKFQAVAERQGGDPGLDGQKRPDDGPVHRFAGHAGNMRQHVVTGFAFDQADDGLLAAGADQDVALPVADLAA